MAADNVMKVWDLRNHQCIQTIADADWPSREDAHPSAMMYDPVRSAPLLIAWHGRDVTLHQELALLSQHACFLFGVEPIPQVTTSPSVDTQMVKWMKYENISMSCSPAYTITTVSVWLSVRLSVRPSVRPSVCLSVGPAQAMHHVAGHEWSPLPTGWLSGRTCVCLTTTVPSIRDP